MVQGENAKVNVIASFKSGVDDEIGLAITGTPVGATLSLGTTSIWTGTATEMIITINSSMSPGDYSVVVTGTGGLSGRIHAATLALKVVAPPPPNDFSVAIAGSGTLTIEKNQSASVTVTATRTQGVDQNVALTGSSSPAGVTGVFSPTTITTGASVGNASTLLVTAGSTTGTFTLTVTGTAPSGARTANLTVNVVDTPPANTYTLTALPTTLIVEQGKSGTVRLAASVLTGVDQIVNITQPAADGSGVTPTLDASTVMTGNSTTLAFAVASNAALSDHVFTVVNSNAGGYSPPSPLTVTVTVVAPPPPNDFSLTVSAGTMPVQAGSAVSINITPNRTQGVDTPIALSVSGLPANTTSNFPTSGSTGTFTAFTVFTTASTPTGIHHLTITGNNGTVSHDLPGTVDLDVRAPPTPNEFAMAANPSTVSIVSGASGTTTIASTWLSGASQTIAMSASGLPGDASVSFSPTSVSVTSSGNTSSTMTINTGTVAASNTPYTFTVIGNNGTTSHSTTVSLTVTPLLAPDDFSISVENTDHTKPASLTLSDNNPQSLYLRSGITNGSPGQVTVTCSGAPAFMIVNCAGGFITPASPTAAQKTIIVSRNGAASGNYTITVTGKLGTVVHTDTFTVSLP